MATVEPFTLNFSILLWKMFAKTQSGLSVRMALFFSDLIITEKKFDNLTSWNYAVSNN